MTYCIRNGANTIWAVLQFLVWAFWASHHCHLGRPTTVYALQIADSWHRSGMPWDGIGMGFQNLIRSYVIYDRVGLAGWAFSDAVTPPHTPLYGATISTRLTRDRDRCSSTCCYLFDPSECMCWKIDEDICPYTCNVLHACRTDTHKLSILFNWLINQKKLIIALP